MPARTGGDREALNSRVTESGRRTRRSAGGTGTPPKLSWKPHQKSQPLVELALHVATIPRNVGNLALANAAAFPESLEEELTQWVPVD